MDRLNAVKTVNMTRYDAVHADPRDFVGDDDEFGDLVWRPVILQFEAKLAPIEDRAVAQHCGTERSLLLSFHKAEDSAVSTGEVWSSETVRQAQRRLWRLSEGSSRAAAACDTWLMGGIGLEADETFETAGVDDGAVLFIQQVVVLIRE